jgi:hypothetical protein
MQGQLTEKQFTDRQPKEVRTLHTNHQAGNSRTMRGQNSQSLYPDNKTHSCLQHHLGNGNSTEEIASEYSGSMICTTNKSIW